MRESELASLLIRMGVASGLDIERAAEELAVVTLPAFVDMRAFRAALIGEVEAQMRAQMEERLQQMRRKLEVDSAPHPPRATSRAAAKPETPPPPATPEPPPAAQATPPPVDRASTQPRITYTPPASELATAPVRKAAGDSPPEMEDLAQLEGGQVVPPTAEEEEMPTDATMVWTTRPG